MSQQQIRNLVPTTSNRGQRFQSSTEPDKRASGRTRQMRKPTSRLVQSLNNRSTPALAYPLNKVTATVRNYQPFCEIYEGDRRSPTSRYTQISGNRRCLPPFFSETIKPSSSSSGTLSHGASPSLSQITTIRECAIRPGRTLPATRVKVSDSGKPSLLANAPTIMKREAHLPKSQKALRTMVDRINAQAQEKGTKHNRFSALPEGLLSGTKRSPYPQKATATSSCTTPSQSTNASSSPRRTALSPRGFP
jgi:hypothetical protein